MLCANFVFHLFVGFFNFKYNNSIAQMIDISWRWLATDPLWLGGLLEWWMFH